MKTYNLSRICTIDIEGVIGVAEEEQFDNPSPTQVSTYERFAEALAQLRAEGGADRLVINIRSLGGDVDQALKIYQAACAEPLEVVTRCWGYVASAATIIAQAASEGCREVSANTLYLIHCCQSSCEGNHLSLATAKELLDKSDNSIAELYAERSGGSKEHFLELMNASGGQGRWLSAVEVVEAGLADRIVPATAITDYASDSLAALGLPPLPTPQPQQSQKRLLGRLAALLTRMGITRPSDNEKKNSEVAVEQSVAEMVPRNLRPTPQLMTTRMASAQPTTLMPIEDPSPTGSAGFKTPNQAAYEQDLEAIRGN